MIKIALGRLDAPMMDIREFHEVFARTPHPSVPTLLTEFQVERRVKWCAEEGEEIRQATTIAQQADGFIDMIYFALGGLDEMGIDPSPLWDIVHGANMAKRQPDGTVARDPVTFKTLKPADWQDPEPLLEAEVQRQIVAAENPDLLAAAAKDLRSAQRDYMADVGRAADRLDAAIARAERSPTWDADRPDVSEAAVQQMMAESGQPEHVVRKAMEAQA